MKFGLLKSKIEKNLLESYSKGKLAEEIKIFKKLVLENKTLSRLYYLYDELNSNKGLNESLVEDFISESIKIYENTFGKLKSSDIKILNFWVEDIKTENLYEHIDNLFTKDILNLVNKVKSKKLVVETLKKEQPKKSELINLPLSSMVKMANQTIEKYIENLNESDKNELLTFLKEDEDKLRNDFEPLKKEIISTLDKVKTNSDSETKQRIDETISKISNEKFDRLTFFKLKNLKESI
jgi:hypothetical protein